MVFHWCLCDSKSSHVSRTFLSILADLNNTLAWMVSTNALIFKSSSSSTNPRKWQLVLLSLSCSIVLYQFSSKVYVFIFLFAFLQFYLMISRDGKLHYSAGSRFFFFFFFFLIFFCWLSLGLFVWPRLGDPFVSQNLKKFVCRIFQDGFWVVHTNCSHGQI